MAAAMFEITLTADDGHTIDVSVDSRDVVRWERETGKALSSFGDGELSMGTMYHLAFIAARRHGRVDGVGQEGLDRLIERYALEIGGDDDDDGEEVGALDPTRPAPSTAPPSL